MSWYQANVCANNTHAAVGIYTSVRTCILLVLKRAGSLSLSVSASSWSWNQFHYLVLLWAETFAFFIQLQIFWYLFNFSHAGQLGSKISWKNLSSGSKKYLGTYFFWPLKLRIWQNIFFLRQATKPVSKATRFCPKSLWSSRTQKKVANHAQGG